MILYGLNMRDKKEKTLVRRKYLFELGFQLVEPLLAERYQNHLKDAIRDILGLKETTQSESPDSPKSSQAVVPQKGTKCIICLEANQQRRTKIGTCDMCGGPFCKEHQAKRCTRCALQQPKDKKKNRALVFLRRQINKLF